MGGTAISKGLAGAIGTVPEVIAISPLENIKLAAQLDKEGKFKGSADITRHIIRTGGFFLSLDVYKGAVSSVVENKLAGDVLAGFAAGATGTALNCWTDVCRSVVQKKALAATFDPNSVRPSAM